MKFDYGRLEFRILVQAHTRYDSRPGTRRSHTAVFLCLFSSSFKRTVRALASEGQEHYYINQVTCRILVATGMYSVNCYLSL